MALKILISMQPKAGKVSGAVPDQHRFRKPDDRIIDAEDDDYSMNSSSQRSMSNSRHCGHVGFVNESTNNSTKVGPKQAEDNPLSLAPSSAGETSITEQSINESTREDFANNVEAPFALSLETLSTPNHLESIIPETIDGLIQNCK